jgi:hypothetical protein
MTKETLKKAAEKQRKMTELGLRIVDTDPWVECKIGGKSYKLEFSYPAVVEIYQKTGMTVGVDEMSARDIMNMLPQLLLAGLRVHHADEFGEGIDLENEQQIERDLMKKVSIRHIVYFTTVISQALSAVQPDAEQLADILGEDLREGEAARPLAVVPILEDSGLNAENLESPVLTLEE